MCSSFNNIIEVLANVQTGTYSIVQQDKVCTYNPHMHANDSFVFFTLLTSRYFIHKTTKTIQHTVSACDKWLLLASITCLHTQILTAYSLYAHSVWMQAIVHRLWYWECRLRMKVKADAWVTQVCCAVYPSTCQQMVTVLHKQPDFVQFAFVEWIICSEWFQFKKESN